MENIQILDSIQADQIEDGDQILVHGDHLENVSVDDDLTDPDNVVVSGDSNETGDRQTYTLHYSDTVEVWCI